MSDSILLSSLQEYNRLCIPEQIDYKKFYLYSIITHSTAIDGSTTAFQVLVKNANLTDAPMTNISTQKAPQRVPNEVSNEVSNEVPNEVSNEMSNVSDTTIAILNLIRETPTITRQELASALELAVKTIQKHITKLKHAGGRIQRMGSSTRGGYWQVIK